VAEKMLLNYAAASTEEGAVKQAETPLMYQIS